MNVRNILGNVSIAFGVLNLLNFYSPKPLPTVGISAFLFGALFIAIGVFVKRKRTAEEGLRVDDAASFLKKLRKSSKNAEQNTDPLTAVRVLRLASEKKGRLTIAQTAMELNIPLESAEKALDECASRGGAYIDIDPSTGIASYRFPEFS